MSMQFLLNIDIKYDSPTDIDLLIQNAVGIIKAHTGLKFRVVGEPRLLAVLEVNNENVVNTICSSLIKDGSYTVMCTQLFPFYKVELFTSTNYGTNYYHWTDITIDFHGNTPPSESAFHELDILWKKEVACQPQGILEIQMFKELGKFRVHMFTRSSKPEGTEYLKLALPENMSVQINKQIKMLTMI